MAHGESGWLSGSDDSYMISLLGPVGWVLILQFAAECLRSCPASCIGAGSLGHETAIVSPPSDDEIG